MIQVRNIPFGEMTLAEILRVLIQGKMPDGTKIDLATRKDSLARVIPMIKEEIAGNNQVINLYEISQRDAVFGDFMRYTRELESLVKQAEQIIA